MTRALIFIAVLVVLLSADAVAQRPAPPVKPTPKPTATPDPDSVFQAELVRISMAEQVNWREFTYPGHSFRAIFPRTPAQRIETLKDPALGNLVVTVFMAIDETGGYGVGQFFMPYAVKDPAAIKELFRGLLAGIVADGFNADEIVSVEHKGRPALLVVGHDSEGNEIEFRAIVDGRNVLFPMLIRFENAESPQSRQENSAAAIRFLDSLEPIPEAKRPEADNPIFSSTVTGSVFTSEYFRFSMTVPSGWNVVEQTDAEGVQRAQREKAGADPNTRRNLFTFAGKPLGMERNPTIICNVVKSPGPFATAKGLATEIRNSLKRDGTYTVVGDLKSEVLGGQTFVVFESKASVLGNNFSQKLLVVIRRDHALVFVLTYSDDADGTAAIKAMATIRFSRL